MFSNKSLTEKEQKKHAELVDNIDTLVDDVLAKNKGSFSDVKVEKKRPSDEFLKRGVNKNQIKIPASDIIILAAIATTLTIVYIAIRNKKLQS